MICSPFDAGTVEMLRSQSSHFITVREVLMSDDNMEEQKESR